MGSGFQCRKVGSGERRGESGIPRIRGRPRLGVRLGQDRAEDPRQHGQGSRDWEEIPGRSKLGSRAPAPRGEGPEKG